MGRRGPKPKPSALDKLDGGASHRKRNRNEPKPAASAGACPAWLRGNRTAAAIWRALAPGRIKLGLLCEGDELAFAALCNEAAIYWRSSRALIGSLTHLNKANGQITRPEVAIRKGALEGMRQLTAAFGMTPADRKGLEVELGAGAARGGDDAAAPAKPKPGTPLAIDDFLQRRAQRRGADPDPAR